MGSDPIFTKNVKNVSHYSYEAYADPAMAAGFDEARFGGPVGQLLLADQQQILFRCLGNLAGQRILDVGTGTGRAAIALAGKGAQVTGVDASQEMLAVARRRAADQHLPITFSEGDAHALRFPNRSFDSVVCLRVLMHVPDWRQSIAELCRVADKRLVIDYPAAGSAAFLQAAWRKTAAAAGARVEAYRVLTKRAVVAELARNGFQIAMIHRQFVLPIALHKFVGSAALTRAVERILASAGLLRLAGSPVTVLAERCAS